MKISNLYSYEGILNYDNTLKEWNVFNDKSNANYPISLNDENQLNLTKHYTKNLEYIDGTSNIIEEASGLKWENIGTGAPSDDSNMVEIKLENGFTQTSIDNLKAALIDIIVGEFKIFTENEWEAFEISNLKTNNYIKNYINSSDETYYYKPYVELKQGTIFCNSLYSKGDIVAYAHFTASDLQLKKNIRPLEYNNELMILKPVTFDWKDKKQKDNMNVGLIAQDVEKVYPHLVKNNLLLDGQNYKTINYEGLIPYMIKHLQNIKSDLNDLEEYLNED